jgi:hypothetical protein
MNGIQPAVVPNGRRRTGGRDVEQAEVVARFSVSGLQHGEGPRRADLRTVDCLLQIVASVAGRKRDRAIISFDRGGGPRQGPVGFDEV